MRSVDVLMFYDFLITCANIIKTRNSVE